MDFSNLTLEQAHNCIRTIERITGSVDWDLRVACCSQLGHKLVQSSKIKYCVLCCSMTIIRNEMC